MSIYIIVSLVVLLFIYILVIYNSFVRLNNKLNKTFSTMDVYLKKRWDLIPNLVEVVKGYAKHEKDTLEEVIKLRSEDYDILSSEEKINANTKVTNGISKIMALAEKYPDLKASDNFRNLSKELTKIEDEIAQSRKYYNATVRVYNNKVGMFPSNVVAGILGYKDEKMFEASKDEREHIKVKL